MAEDQEKPGKAGTLFPIGGAIALLILQRPMPPALLFSESGEMWKIIHGVGLLIGLTVGYYLTNKAGRLQPKKKGLAVIGGVLVAFLSLFIHYRYMRNDAENHAIAITVEFAVIAILIGILLFLAAPAARFLTGREE